MLESKHVAAILLGVGGLAVLTMAVVYLVWPRGRLARERAEANRKNGWPVDVRTFGWRLVPIALLLIGAGAGLALVRIKPQAPWSAERPEVASVGAVSLDALGESLRVALERGDPAPLEAVMLPPSGPTGHALRSDLRADLAKGPYVDVEVERLSSLRPLREEPNAVVLHARVDRRRGAFSAEGVQYRIHIEQRGDRYFLIDSNLFRDNTLTLLVLAVCALLFPLLLVLSILNRRTTRLLHRAEAECGELARVAVRLRYRGPLRGRRGVLALGQDRLLWFPGGKRRHSFALAALSDLREHSERGRTGRKRRGIAFRHDGAEHIFFVRHATAWLSALKEGVEQAVG